MVARDRLERGVPLNHPEAVALLSTWVVERAREGAGVAELMEAGRHVLGADQVHARASPRCCTTSRSRRPSPTAASW